MYVLYVHTYKQIHLLINHITFQPFFTERVFQIFDKDNSGSISLQEFLDAMHQFSGQSPEDKIRFLFKVYDLDGKSDAKVEKNKLLNLHNIRETIYYIINNLKLCYTYTVVYRGKRERERESRKVSFHSLSNFFFKSPSNFLFTTQETD